MFNLKVIQLLQKLLALIVLLASAFAQANVSLPNGTFNESITELQVKVQGGVIRIQRDYLDGYWEINNRWNSLKFEYDDLDGSISVIDRSGGKYQKQGDAWVLNTSYLIRRSSVNILPIAPESFPSAGVPGNGGQPLTSVQGYRWQNRDGDWVEYDNNGRISSYGDRNDNRVWFQYDNAQNLKYILDHQGRVAFIYTWQGKILSKISDNPAINGDTSTPARSVSYIWNDDILDIPTATPVKRLLLQATDANGNSTKYTYLNYGTQNQSGHIKTITDAEGRIRTLSYVGERVYQLVEPDGAITQYSYEYDKVKRQFYIKKTLPQTAAGKTIEEYWYDSEGYLIRRDLNSVTQSTLKIDTSARTRTRTDAAGNITITTLDEYDNPIKVQNPDGSFTTARYSATLNKVIEQTDELGIKTSYDYDSKGNLLKHTQAVGLPEQTITEYSYDSRGNVLTVTRKGRTESNGYVTPDTVWQYGYNSLDQIIKITAPEGGIREYGYNHAGYLLSQINPNRKETRYTVDANGHLTQISDVLNRSIKYSYDKVGNLTSATNESGKKTLVAYDTMNRLQAVTSPLGGTASVQYNAQGIPVAEEDEDGRKSFAEFDSFMRISKEIDGLGNITQYSYSKPENSSAGGVGGLFDPTEIKYPTFTQRQGYDTRGRPVVQTTLNPNQLGTEGLTTSNEYDKRGQLKSATDANGKTRFYTFDALGNLIQLTDSLGNKTKVAYDARGNLIAITDAKGNLNKFEFDRNDRVIKEILPLGQTTTYTYDDADNLIQKVDANGHITEYRFDEVNRPIEVKQSKAGGLLARTTHFAWSEIDNLTGWTDTDHTRSQTSSAVIRYDDNNQKTSEAITYPNGETLSYSYGYSLAGKKTRLTWPDGTAIDYTYSAHGELDSVTIPGEGVISVNQFKWVAPAKITLPGGTTQERTLDGLLNLEDLKVKNPGQQTVLNLANTYGKVQELKTQNRTDTNTGSNSQNSVFNYDDEIRLTQVNTDKGGLFGTETENFTLDAVGNRIAHSKVNGAWVYDANNRLTQLGNGQCGDAGVTCYQYDAVGNLTRKHNGNQITQFAYDTQNRLVEVRDGQNNLIARYGYDPLDARIWKEQYRDISGQLLAKAVKTHYLYSDEGLIAESTQSITLNADGTSTANGAATISTQYGPRPDAEFGTGILFIKTQDSAGQNRFAYYHHDHLQTPLQATDKAGNIVWSAHYNAFGRATITTPAATAEKPTIQSNVRLPGQYEDAETGLHYNYRRYYDPETGRYISQDPIGIDGGLNQYQYAKSDPVNLSDPTGECPMCAAYAICVAQCMAETALFNTVNNECNEFGKIAKDCAMECALGMGIGKAAKWLKRGWNKLFDKAAGSCPVNSFPADTVVHIKPPHGKDLDAQQSRSTLKPISQIQVGDEVLALSEWKNAGTDPQRDARLSYEKVTDVFTSHKPQTLVHISLSTGETLSATEGHAFKTTDGWRDAILLKKGGKLLLKGGDGDKDRTATITGIRTEQKTLPVFNIEVANAHTYFVGESGELVHNGVCKITPPTHPDFIPHKKKSGPAPIPWDPKKKGFPDKSGDYWQPVPDGHKGTHPPHWDVQHPDGGHTPVYPGKPYK